MEARSTTLLLVVVLLTTGLAGCLGGSEGTADGERIQKQRAEVSESRGGIEGLVTDNAVQPVTGATIVVEELALETTTEDDGSYAFSEIPPGEYTLAVNTTGYVPAKQLVQVSAGSVAVVDFVLVHLASDEAYRQKQEMTGFIECSITTGFDVRPDTDPTLHQVDDAVNNTTGRDPSIRGIGYFYYGRAVCSQPNSIAENTTQDRFIHFFDLEPPLRTIVYAMHWQGGGAMSDTMTTIMEVKGFYNTFAGRLLLVMDGSPIEVRVDYDDLQATQQRFISNCEDEEIEAYCGYSFFDEGWPLALRVFAAWQCGSDKVGTCAPIQQPFTHYVTAYYNAEAPEGASAVPGA